MQYFATNVRENANYFKKEKFLFFQNKEEIMLNVVIVTYDVTHIFFSLNLFASKFGNPNTGRAGLHSAF